MNAEAGHLPLVSAVIPAYNAEAFVADAIRSVLGQAYPRVECVVVDDGSTDGTRAVIERTFGDDVRYIHKPNAGVSSARNAGGVVASGEFVAFLDADDLWLPRKIEHQVERFKERPDLGLAYTGLHLVNDHLDFVGRVDAVIGRDALVNTLLLERPFMSGVGSSGMVPAEVFRAVGGFDERLSTSADYDFGCRVAARYPVDGIRKPLVLYRLHPSQIHRGTEATAQDMALAFDKLFDDHHLPAEFASKRRRAQANLDVSLAGAYLQSGRRGRFAVHALKAALRRPDRVAAAIKRLSAPGGGISRAH